MGVSMYIRIILTMNDLLTMYGISYSMERHYRADWLESRRELVTVCRVLSGNGMSDVGYCTVH
jgi:hypothetical protein